ncbi:MAG: hypothetical protein AB7Q81_12415 [Gammaproteobacteria bacterium]
MSTTTDSVDANEDINDDHLLGARGLFLGDKTTRALFWGYAKDANKENSGKSRREFSKNIRDLLGNNYLSKAEADYCAGWAALAVQLVEGTHDEDDKLVDLLENALPGGDGARITGG